MVTPPRAVLEACHRGEVAMRWFRPAGILFLPVSVVGWLFTGLAVGFCAQVFLFVDARSHSVSDTLYGVFPFWAPALLGLAWIADRSGGRRERRRCRSPLRVRKCRT